MRRPRAAVAAAAAAMLLFAGEAQGRPGSHTVAVFKGPPAGVARVPAPPSMSSCLKHLRSRCYTPAELLRAYDLGPLRRAGIDGTGRTIVIIDAFGSPTIRSDLRHFDRAFGIPSPPSFRIYQPAGRVPHFSLTKPDRPGWAGETTLDVEWAHAFAPGASIVLLETPVDETEGTHGMPQMMTAVRWALDHHVGDVISMSFGATEQTFPSRSSILNLRAPFAQATAQQVGLISATGDSGAAEPERHSAGLFPFRATQWPGSDPLVLAAGGTTVKLSATGSRLAPDVVWRDRDGAGGGGRSTVFARPSYQDPLAGIVGDHRGVPDISMDASDRNGPLVYASFDRSQPEWAVLGGTSFATVELAGLVADADQLAGHSLGGLPARVYAVAQRAGSGIADITAGNNSFGPFVNSDGSVHRVRGFTARRGYDLASGFGTVNAARFVPALASGR